MATETYEQTDEQVLAEAKAALEAERIAEQDKEADERAEKYAAEQAEQDRSQPDRPEGAADEGGDILAADEEPGDTTGPEPSLAEKALDAAGITGDHAEARADAIEKKEKAQAELANMPERKLNSVIGGEEPTLSEFKLSGKSLELGSGTQFEKGERTTFLVEVEWGAVALIDKHDKETGQIVDTVRRHTARIIGYGVENGA